MSDRRCAICGIELKGTHHCNDADCIQALQESLIAANARADAAEAQLAAVSNSDRVPRHRLEAETARADAAEKHNEILAGSNRELLAKIERIIHECEATSDDYAPDCMPFEVADVVGRIEEALEDKPWNRLSGSLAKYGRHF